MFDIVEQMLPQEFLVQMQPAVVESLIFSCFFYAFMKILHFEDGANRFIDHRRRSFCWLSRRLLLWLKKPSRLKLDVEKVCLTPSGR